MNKFVGWGGATVVGLVGAAAAFFLDPKDGPQRRRAAVEKGAEIARRERAHVNTMFAGSSKPKSAAVRAREEALSAAIRENLTQRFPDLNEKIGVGVVGHRVTLRGEVPEMRLIGAIAQLVQDVDGVDEVNNLLRLEMVS